MSDTCGISEEFFEVHAGYCLNFGLVKKKQVGVFVNFYFNCQLNRR